MSAIRLGRALGATRQLVVVLVPAVTFEVEEVSVIFDVSTPEVTFETDVMLDTDVEFESARHAGGGVGRSLKDHSQTSGV
jgi:hypothetical protein